MNRNDIPFAPRRVPIFYGWAILCVGTVGFLLSVPGQTMGVSVFTDHLLAALGLERIQLSTAYMFGTILSSLLLTRAGKLYDRFGARVMGPASAMGLAAVLLALSYVDAIAGLVNGWLGLGWVVPFSVVLVGFFLLRFTGQGVLTLVSRNMIMKWFDRHRGLANGLTGLGVALGFSLAPRIFKDMIDAWGWRGAWRVMAGVIGLAFAGVALLLYRDNPEDCGLLPDGSPARRGDDEPDKPPRPAVRQFTLSEAMRCYSFWIFAAGLSMFALYLTGLTFHIESIWRTAGLPKEAATEIFLPSAIIAVVVHLSGGWISDHVRLKYLLMVELGGLCASAAGLMLLGPWWSIWLVIIGNGFCQGMFGVLSAVTWPDYFGRRHLGAISGRATAMLVFSSAVGPTIFSLSKRWTASYASAGVASGVVCALLIFAAIRANNPQGR
jgi:sugar phosphate permease